MTASETQTIRSFVQAVLADGVDNSHLDARMERFLSIAHIEAFTAGATLVQHHALADDIHFLAEGRVRYRHLVSDDTHGESISHERTPWMPMGWSSFNFRRYRVTIVAESDGCLLTLPLAAWQTLQTDEPKLWAYLSAFMFRTATQLLWEARGLEQAEPINGMGSEPDLVPVSNLEADKLEEMYRQSPCFSVLPAACRRWMAENSQLFQFAERTQIVKEGEASQGLWLLNGGRVALRFRMMTETGVKTAVRYAARPGTLLCWATIGNMLSAPYQIEVTRPTQLAFLPREALNTLLTENPQWLGAIFQQQLWQTRRYLRTTRTQYTDVDSDGGIRALSNLIEDSSPALPVDSLLYGVPYLLQNRLTREEGFQRLYHTHHRGTDVERSVASLALDILLDFERAHRFFTSLQAIYAAVIRNRHLPPAALRKVVTSRYRDALAHVPYVIQGWENLPDDPNCIFIYNHMAYGEDTPLANGFYFNPDSHFLSGMILEPKYGDGIRVARSNDKTEFWRADYYERLGHISVTTPESGWLNETAAEKQRRKEKFYADCQAVLASGQPFIIAPEGTITEEQSVTERTPGPMRPGAFLMSGRFPSKPKIVPVAFANFDKPIYRTLYAVVIKPAFTMEERGVDINDRAAMGQFLQAYREEFRGYVEEAIALAKQVEAPGADLSNLITNVGQVGTVYEEFEHDVRALEIQLSQWRRAEAATVFYGSSTLRLWDTLAEDMGMPDAINLGFGGSTLEACRLYFERLVLPLRPSHLIFYGGENDIGVGKSAEFVLDQFRRFADVVQGHLPDIRCWFISLKPSPSRLEYLAEIERTNTLIADAISQHSQWQYVDFYSYLLDADGQPNARLFSPDQLHLNIAAYGILAKLLRQELQTRAIS